MNELESNKDGLERFAREQYLMKKEEEDILIVDLPGIYSLSPYTSEEIVSRNFILAPKNRQVNMFLYKFIYLD